MAKPLIKKSRQGLLHRNLGIPADEPIPAALLAKALKSKNPKVRARAQFAKNMGKARGRR